MRQFCFVIHQKKVFKAFKAYLLFLRGDTVVTTMPSFLKVELSRHCTVNCLSCFPRKEKIFYSFDEFKYLVDTLGEFIFISQLYEIGEPLHHPELIKCIEYAHKKNIATVISTTLSIKKPDCYWEELVESGLDRMIVAIDGITKPVYNRYRTCGNLDIAMRNLEKLLKINKKVHIEWQMIDFDWNRCEQYSARKLAYNLGCNSFQIIEDNSGRVLQKDKIRNTNCIWPYFLFLVDAYNDVIPCFKLGCNLGIIGNMSQDFDKIWNGEEIQRIRSKILIKLRDGCCSCIE